MEQSGRERIAGAPQQHRVVRQQRLALELQVVLPGQESAVERDGPGVGPMQFLHRGVCAFQRHGQQGLAVPVVVDRGVDALRVVPQQQLGLLHAQGLCKAVQRLRPLVLALRRQPVHALGIHPQVAAIRQCAAPQDRACHGQDAAGLQAVQVEELVCGGVGARAQESQCVREVGQLLAPRPVPLQGKAGEELAIRAIDLRVFAFGIGVGVGQRNGGTAEVRRAEQVGQRRQAIAVPVVDDGDALVLPFARHAISVRAAQQHVVDVPFLVAMPDDGRQAIGIVHAGGDARRAEAREGRLRRSQPGLAAANQRR